MGFSAEEFGSSILRQWVFHSIGLSEKICRGIWFGPLFFLETAPQDSLCGIWGEFHGTIGTRRPEDPIPPPPVRRNRTCASPQSSGKARALLQIIQGGFQPFHPSSISATEVAKDRRMCFCPFSRTPFRCAQESPFGR